MAERAGRRVYLHVGVPKTGTTHLQDVLWRHRTELLTAGVCYPLTRREEHFAAAMDLRQAAWGGRRNPAWQGTWDRLAGTARSSPAPTAVLSSELLAAATEAQAGRAAGSFGDADVHVVLTVRDLARQLPSGWQEQVKHRQTMTLEQFVAGCLGGDGGPTWTPGMGRRFWLHHDVPAVAGRWAAAVGPERVHLVTVPRPGSSRRLLWDRFAGVVGIGADVGIDPLGGPRSNTSLGPTAAELLRRLNEGDVGGIRPDQYDPVVRAILAEKVLTRAGPAGEPGLTLPPGFGAEVATRAAAVVEQLRTAGYPVAGDLDELVPGPPAEAAGPPDDSALAAVAVRATAGLIGELGPLERRLRTRSGGPGRPRSERRPIPRPPRRPARARETPGPVFIHIGAPKTGTTFLQDVLWHHRDALADRGLLFTRERYDEHYRASLDLRGAPRQPSGTAGSWDRVAALARRWPGTAVVSHELFAAATADQAARAIDALGRDRVHVVYSVRDMWGLLAAEWQESTKHGRGFGFEEFLHDVLERGPDGTVGRWFWSVHDAADVLRRWGAGLPPDRVHVVTVPPAGADPATLWTRFAIVLGIEPDSIDTSVARPNASLGAAEVTFLRQVNAALSDGPGRRPDRAMRGRYVKGLLAQGVLAQRPGKQRFAPPPERFDDVRGRAVQTVQRLAAAGYAVTGDLAELVPREPGPAGPHPDHVPAAELAAVGADALTGLVRHAVRLRATHLPGGPPPAAGGDGAAAGPGWLPGRLRSRLPDRVQARLPTFLPASPPASLPGSLPARLPALLPARLDSRLRPVARWWRDRLAARRRRR